MIVRISRLYINIYRENVSEHIEITQQILKRHQKAWRRSIQIDSVKKGISKFTRHPYN